MVYNACPDDVSNLGDAAYWASSVYVMYAAFHGNTYAVQSVLIDPSKDLKTMQTKVMQSLLSHLEAANPVHRLA